MKVISLISAIMGICFVLVMSNCNNASSQRAHTDIEPYNLVIIDGCEYIENSLSSSNNYSLTHRGNCKNPIHNQIAIIHDTISVEVLEHSQIK